MNLKDQTTERATTLTRRIVLSGAVAGALTLLLPRHVLGSMDTRATIADLERTTATEDPALYVFRASSANRIVIAATWEPTSRVDARLRIHTGERTWTIEVPAGSSRLTALDSVGCQTFTGLVFDRTGADNTLLQAVVIEAPSRLLSSGGVAHVWAERHSQGSRRRFGSPFMVRLSAKSRLVANLYHASSPEQDGEGLHRAVAQVISSNAYQNGYAGNPVRYGRRIASVITPDALRYDPQLPIGFTFAAQNGRHPNDAANSVVDTVLDGTLATHVPQPSFPLKDQFPYFAQPSSRT